MKLVIELLGFKHGKSYGFEEYLFNLLRDFSRYRDKIKAEEIIIVCHDSQKEYFKPILTDGMSVFGMSYNNKIGRLWQSERVAQVLGLGKEDLILYPGDMMPLCKNRTKTLLVVHDLLFMYNSYCEHTLYFNLFRLQQWLFEPQAVRKADKVIAISNFTKNDIIRKISVSGDKIEAIYNYFCFDKYNDGNKTTIEKVNYPYILTVCAGNKHKNHKVLLESFVKLASEKEDLHYVIVGSLHANAVPYYEQIPDGIKERIHFLRHISNSDLAYLYSNAKLFVSASLFEGLGMPVVEALYFGVPVILSNTEVHREVSFNKAIYFDSDSAKDLYEKAKEILEGKLMHAPIDKQVIINCYSSENTSMKYIDVINSLLLK